MSRDIVMAPARGISAPSLMAVLFFSIAGCSNTFSELSLPFLGEPEKAGGTSVASGKTGRKSDRTLELAAARRALPKGTRGTLVRIESGDTVYELARKYGVSARRILETNQIEHPELLRIGERLVIPIPELPAPMNAARSRRQVPTRSSSFGPKTLASAPPNRTRPEALRQPRTASGGNLIGTDGWAGKEKATHSAGVARNPGLHPVVAGESLRSIAAKKKVSWAELAMLNGLEPTSPIRAGQILALPRQGGQFGKNNGSGTVARLRRKGLPVARYRRTALAGSARSADRTVTGSIRPDADATAARKVKKLKPNMGFRWPVRGRVIRDYGLNPAGEFHDGISISVPEGAVVRAAQDGIVSYAGSQHLDYGNLVILRHDDGWVSIYAHNSRIEVVPGQIVQRGQPVARAGRTGRVMVPQVHFKLRKNTRPVDPGTVLVSQSTR